MDTRVELIDTIKAVKSRKTSPYGPHKSCEFTLMNGACIVCGFIPKIRVGWKVKITGNWSDTEENVFTAEEVVRYGEKVAFVSKDKQTKLIGDNKDE